jgi:hypothetical protein
MPTGNLPPEGKKLWERVYDDALKGSCKGDEGCAAGSAWKAVHNAGWNKDENGKWTKKAMLTEFSLRIEKASFDKATQERRWRAVASDVDDDKRNDNMSLELYSDFLSRIDRGELVPDQYQSDFWKGGMPYISVSHYDDLNGKGVPGIVDAVYVDGKVLKSKGRFSNTPLGIRCFDAICDDLYNPNVKSNKVRVSIGFLDWAHKHKSNDFIFERKSISDICPECLKELITGEYSGKVYLKGQLVHLALTRVPANERTSMEVEKSMAITQREDASSIIGEDLAEELDELQKTVKSEALVTFSEAETEVAEPVVEESAIEDSNTEVEKEEDEVEECTKKKRSKGEKKSEVEILESLAVLTKKVDDLATLLKPVEAPVAETHPLDAEISQFKQDFSTAISMEISPDEKLQLLQDSYNKLGEAVIHSVKKVEPKSEPTVADNSQLTELANVVASLAQKVDLLTVRLSEGASELPGPKVPQPRSLRPQPFIPQAQTSHPNKPLSLKSIVNRSVGLPE